MLLTALSMAALLLATGCDTRLETEMPPAEPKVEVTREDATSAAKPDPAAIIISASVESPEPTSTSVPMATPDEPLPASPTPPTATTFVSEPEILKTPIPSEPAPSGWQTYYNGEFGFSIDHPRYELVRDEPDRPYLRDRIDQNMGLWVTVHEVTGENPLGGFAERYRGEVLESYGLEHLASEILLTEEDQDGRRFFGMNYTSPADPGKACESLNFVRITLSHAYPAKPYAFVISAGRCTGERDPFQPTLVKDIRELGVALRRFREWDYYRDEQLGWSVSAAPGWTSNGWDRSRVLLEGRLRAPFNMGLLFTEDESQGMFLVEIHRFSEDQLSDFADKYRTNLLRMATEQQSPVFEMSSVATTLFRGRQSAQYAVREQTSDEYCVQEVTIQHILIEPPGYGEVVITATGGVCESAPADVGGARDAMLESLRP